MMIILKLTGLLILSIGLAYVAYGALGIYIASLNVAELSAEISQYINATGATWEEWRKPFFRGGAYAIGLGIFSVIAGIGIVRTKPWGRTIWIFLSPILLLTQFAEGQKSLTCFKLQGAFHLACALFIIIAVTWFMLLLPSSRREFKKSNEHQAPRNRFVSGDS